MTSLPAKVVFFEIYIKLRARYRQLREIGRIIYYPGNNLLINSTPLVFTERFCTKACLEGMESAIAARKCWGKDTLLRCEFLKNVAFF